MAKRNPAPPHPFPTWDATNPTESLKGVYEWAAKNGQDQIRWYQEKKRSKRRGSLWIRALSILFVAIGGLCPLIDATDLFADSTTWLSGTSLGQWGYVFLALAAALIGYDRYFGLSTAWMRFIVTQLSIERALKEFRYDWLILLVQQDSTEMNIPVLLQRAKDFTLQVENLVRQETDSWVLEFQSNIAQLEKVLKTEAEARKPGSIRVVVANGRDFDRVCIRMNDAQVKELVGVTEGIIDGVPPGRYEIVVVGKKGSAEPRAAKVVEVQADAMALVELALPTPVAVPIP
ncbi:MAG TPA: SLATT domain-containing protein [Herpetosiphonaceae bacterium]